MHILAGQDDRPAGFAAMEITIPAGFAGPVPRAHDEFDAAIYVLSGGLEVFGYGEPREAGPGSTRFLGEGLPSPSCATSAPP